MRNNYILDMYVSNAIVRALVLCLTEGKDVSVIFSLQGHWTHAARGN